MILKCIKFSYTCTVYMHVKNALQMWLTITHI